MMSVVIYYLFIITGQAMLTDYAQEEKLQGGTYVQKVLCMLTHTKPKKVHFSLKEPPILVAGLPCRMFSSGGQHKMKKK